MLLPQCFLLIDEILDTACDVLNGLVVHPGRMEYNLQLTRGLNMAEAVMIELTKRGMSRQIAHAVVRECSMAALRKNLSLKEALLREPKVKKYLSEKDIDALTNPKRYMGSATATVERVLKELRPLQRK